MPYGKSAFIRHTFRRNANNRVKTKQFRLSLHSIHRIIVISVIRCNSTNQKIPLKEILFSLKFSFFFRINTILISFFYNIRNCFVPGPMNIVFSSGRFEEEKVHLRYVVQRLRRFSCLPILLLSRLFKIIFSMQINAF